mgnify:CR=1 FL=1|jgi:DNA-binding GntR family transcriptional regulator
MTESLHEKIYNELLHKIKTHFYEEGDQLPTEAELALQYNASKAPVRQALDRLQQEGLDSSCGGRARVLSLQDDENGPI